MSSHRPPDNSAPTAQAPCSAGRDLWCRAVTIALLLGAVTLWVFLPLRHAEFLNYDDDVHVTQNPHVQAGLTRDGLVWALAHVEKWIPMTWLSHMLDCQLFGVDAGAHHLSGVALHLLNAWLLLAFLLRSTGAVWPSAVVAALFALHPLHVEPVAWISSRPHLVSTCFWFAALLAYRRYTQRRTAGRYALVALCMALSVMGKGMGVTLPLVFLLLDYWPLRRGGGLDPGRMRPRGLFLEKLPLAVIAAADVAMQLVEQRAAGALVPLAVLPFPQRLANATVAYAAYLGQMIWPVDLALPYPLPSGPVPNARLAGAAAALAAVTALVMRSGRAHPYLITGWLWYLVTLLPVIGFVQIGVQAMADRYTYVPLIGVFVMLAWGGAAATQQRPTMRPVLAIATALALAAFALTSRAQVGYWTNSLTLFAHTLAVTRDNPIAENNYGLELNALGRREEARAHFAESLRTNPNSAETQNNMGAVLAALGQTSAAEEHFRTAVRLRPNLAPARLNLGRARFRQGDIAGAMEQFTAVLQLEPDNAAAHAALGAALTADRRDAEARAAYTAALALYEVALRLNPNQPAAQYGLGEALEALGRRDEARRHFEAALRLQPTYGEALYHMGVILAEAGDAAAARTYFRAAGPLADYYVMHRIKRGLARLQAGDPAGAREQFSFALQVDPQKPVAQLGLAQALDAEGRRDEARAAYEHALQLDPNLPGVHFHLAQALSAEGRLEEAVAHYREELRIDPGRSDAENNLAAALKTMGRTEEARAHFAAALRLDPGSAEAHYNLGVLRVEDGDPAGAAPSFREALRLRPDYSAARIALGLVLLGEGDAASAVEQFRIVTAQHPDHADARAHLAEAEAALQRTGGRAP